MLEHIFALLGLVVLCGAWMAFQLWLKKVNPEKDGYRPGCGACSNGSCSKRQP